MPDLFSHACLTYSICMLLSWRYNWLTPSYMTVGMAGAFVPDLAKADLVADSATVAATLNRPFSWFVIHTLGGTVVGVLIGATVAASEERRHGFALLSVGAASHLLSDTLLLKASGRSHAVLWPLTGTIALAVWQAHRRN